MTDLFYRDGTPLIEQDRPRIKETRRADTFTIAKAFPCTRCGGQGGWKGWPGYFCYQCGGRNSMVFHVRQIKLYTAERLSALNEAAEKKALKKRAGAEKLAAKKRAEFIAWAKPHGKLIGRILLAAKPDGTDFISDLAYKLRSKWALTDNQLRAAANVLNTRDLRKAQDAESQHVGAEGDRLEFEAKVDFTMERDSYYGITTIVKFRDEHNNVFTWFASGYRDLARGDRISIRGTVKKHDEYKGVKQTVLTRCKYEKFTIMTADETANAEAVA